MIKIIFNNYETYIKAAIIFGVQSGHRHYSRHLLKRAFALSHFRWHDSLQTCSHDFLLVSTYLQSLLCFTLFVMQTAILLQACGSGV